MVKLDILVETKVLYRLTTTTFFATSRLVLTATETYTRKLTERLEVITRVERERTITVGLVTKGITIAQYKDPVVAASRLKP